MGILVRCLTRDQLVVNVQFPAGMFVEVAGELRAVVRANHRETPIKVMLTPLKCRSESVCSVFGRTIESNIVGDNGAVINIDNRQHIEEPFLTGNIAIFDVGFPQLVGARNLPIGGNPSGVFRLNFTLWTEDTKLLAKTIDFFLVNVQVKLPPKSMCKLQIPIEEPFTPNQRNEPLFNDFVRYPMAIECPGVPWYRTASRIRPYFGGSRLVLTVIVG
jgi:hypothetical protein